MNDNHYKDDEKYDKYDDEYGNLSKQVLNYQRVSVDEAAGISFFGFALNIQNTFLFSAVGNLPTVVYTLCDISFSSSVL